MEIGMRHSVAGTFLEVYPRRKTWHGARYALLPGDKPDFNEVAWFDPD